MENTPHITLIGIGDRPNEWLRETDATIIKHHLFAGGNRHYELVRSSLPENHSWIPVTGDIMGLIKQLKSCSEPIAVFASGDPFFFGLGNTLKRLLPEASISVIPWFSSIQLLCHKIGLAINEVHCITVHGRTWQHLDTALIAQKPIIGILTDASKNPKAIARRLLEYRFDEYEMTIGEHLNLTNEASVKSRITGPLKLSEVANCDFKPLNVVLLQKTSNRIHSRSFEDNRFQTLEGRPGMMTKKQIRALVVQALELENKSTFWDIGSCTGAIAIECKRAFPDLNVIAFEKRPECKKIISNNCRQLHTPGIAIEISDVLDNNLGDLGDEQSHGRDGKELNKPDAVFIGGHGNRLEEMISKVDHYLAKGGNIVMNAASANSVEIFRKTAENLHYQLKEEMELKIGDFNPVTLLSAKKK